MKQTKRHSGLRVMMLVCTALFGAALTWVVADLPASSEGLSRQVQASLKETGVKNPVTAVLLNFRAYDTLLEIAVLTLALVAMRSFETAAHSPRGRPVTDVQLGLVHVLGPFAVLFAAYLLWSGTDQPGGAFQAGAVLGALGVLMRLSEARLGRRRRRSVRLRLGWGLVGLACFTLVGTWNLCLGRQLLEYSLATTGAVLLLLELGAMISIGYILTDLVCGESEADA